MTTTPTHNRMKIDHYREPGTVLWFEYHCTESHQSAHAEWWYRSHQQVTVIRCVNAEDYGNAPQQDRCECGQPLVYTVRWSDGFEGDVFEDELLDSPDEYERPAPPQRPQQLDRLIEEKTGRVDDEP